MTRHTFVFFILLCSCAAKQPPHTALDLSQFTRDSCRFSYDTSLLRKVDAPPANTYCIEFKNEWDGYVFAIKNGQFLNLDFYKTERSTAITGKSILVPQSASADSLTFINLSNLHYITFRTNPGYKVVDLFYYQHTWIVVFANGYTMAY